MRRTWLWTLGALLALAGLSYALFLWLSPPALPEGFLYGSGRVEATEVQVAAEVTGRVLESQLAEGRTVEANEVLARLDETDVRTRLKQAEANVSAAARAQERAAEQLRTWRHHLQTAQADLARYRKLRASGDVSAQMLDQAENRFREARGQVEALTAAQAQAAARREAAAREVELLRSQLDKTVVRAPIAGTVLTKGIEVGELATPGRVIAVLADLTQVELKVYVPERELAKIRLGDPARVRVDAFPDRYFEARVARVDPRAQFTPKDVHMPDERARLVFGVTLALQSGEGYLRPGMPADAWIRWEPTAAWPERLAVPG